MKSSLRRRRKIWLIVLVHVNCGKLQSRWTGVARVTFLRFTLIERRWWLRRKEHEIQSSDLEASQTRSWMTRLSPWLLSCHPSQRGWCLFAQFTALNADKSSRIWLKLFGPRLGLNQCLHIKRVSSWLSGKIFLVGMQRDGPLDAKSLWKLMTFNGRKGNRRNLGSRPINLH